MLPIVLMGLLAIGTAILCARGWWRHYFRMQSFDGSMTHGMHMTIGTSLTLFVWTIFVLKLLRWLEER